MAVSDNTSSPTPASFKTPQDELAYYKTQYEHLAGELQEFQASSKELEAELEKDIEASEKRERSLKEKVEGLRYEVDEWKTKYKQSKAEANQAQNSLQKEITSLRDTNRTLQLKLRDIEVANDDYERQARNTTSSLEDLESKYNVSLERGVMMEEEIKVGEQERESLRIETQRLRDELSDLKVESEITQEKLRSFENNSRDKASRTSQISQTSDPRLHQPKSPGSERSTTSFSTPEVSTPPAAKSEASGTVSDVQTPPSPPLSESSAPTKPAESTPIQAKETTANVTPRVGYQTMPHPRYTRGPGLLSTNGNTTTPSFARRTAAGTTPRPRGAPTDSLPRSGSLYQIRGLIGKMQRLEERVQTARSKLPASTNTPPSASPNGSVHAEADLPSNVTVRSSRKRLTTNETDSEDVSTPTRPVEEGTRRLTQRQSRLSMGGSSVDMTNSRPSSRASFASHGGSHLARPASRTGYAGRGGLMGDASTTSQSATSELRRPRSSLSGRGTPSHGYRQSISGNVSEEVETATPSFATPTARRTTLERNGLVSSIPAPSSALRRQSGKMGPPDRIPSQQKKQTQQLQQQPELGDTY